MGSKLKLHWYLFFLHEGPWPCDEKKVVRKLSSMTLNEALFGRQPVSLYFYYFLRENKEWNYIMMINLWLLIYVLCSFLDNHHVHGHIYLFACIAFCYQCDVFLSIHVLYIAGLVVLYT
jgi:hypothetical protein